MKRKKYKVQVKLVFTTIMDHEQTSMENAKKDVQRVINDYIKNKLDITKMFDTPPHTIYKVDKYDR